MLWDLHYTTASANACKGPWITSNGQIILGKAGMVGLCSAQALAAEFFRSRRRLADSVLDEHLSALYAVLVA